MKVYLLLLLLAVALSANAQDKPSVFVQGKGSENVSSNGSAAGGSHWAGWGSKSTIDSHDEAMEVTKDLQKQCSGVIMTVNQANADYIVMMNRESKQNRGLLRTNSQVQVANKAGDILGSNATRTVGNAAKDACALIVSDWQSHGSHTAAQAAPSTAPASVVAQPTVQSTSAVQVVPAVNAAGQVQPASVVTATTQVREVPADPKPTPIATPAPAGHATVGIFAEGNVNVRHDGVILTAVTPGGPADQVGIKAGDTILAINEHYLFTIAELRESIGQLIPGSKAVVRYRRYSTILDVPVTVGAIQ